MNRLDFYQDHLNRVSRSFALCISRLEGPLRGWVSLTYLLCRILDTVEDANWSKYKAQLSSLDQFDDFVESSSRLDKVSSWGREFPTDIPEGERRLIQDAGEILRDLHQAPGPIRGLIQSLVRSMSAGMRHFAENKNDGVLRLRGLCEVNQYCFFVAGIVGETLSKLLAAVDAKMVLSKSTVVDAHHFGLFLQKVNLLKDQFADEKEGRFLVPSRSELYLSLSENAQGAMRYIESIPLSQNGYRVFCLWSLFLGLRTLPLLKDSTGSVVNLKLSRNEALGLFAQVEAVAEQPEVLREGFRKLVADAGLGVSGPAVSPAELPLDCSLSWFQGIYSGSLDFDGFSALKMV